MFLLTKPDASRIQSFLEQASKSDLSYPYIGKTLEEFPPNTQETMNYNLDHNHIVVGNGREDFERAKHAIRNWRMFDIGWVDLCWPDVPIEEGRNVAILIKHLGFYSLNAARIVYTINEEDRFGFAYGTLEDHGERGEERFSVTFGRETEDVVYDIFAFSRPNHFSLNSDIH